MQRCRPLISGAKSLAFTAESRKNCVQYSAYKHKLGIEHFFQIISTSKLELIGTAADHHSLLLSQTSLRTDDCLHPCFRILVALEESIVDTFLRRRMTIRCLFALAFARNGFRRISKSKSLGQMAKMQVPHVKDVLFGRRMRGIRPHMRQECLLRQCQVLRTTVIRSQVTEQQHIPLSGVPSVQR